jgi:hypothetical protein
VKIVLYQLAHGVRQKLMVNFFNVGTSTIRKYIDIVCDILSSKDKLYVVYIHTLKGEHLMSWIL